MGDEIMNQEFKALFNLLCNQPYEAHWFTRVPPEKVISGVPSDCSDRAYVLADFCEKNQISYSFVLTLFTQPHLSLHIALVVDGRVYDPIWGVYGVSIFEYKTLLNGRYSWNFGSWIQKIIP